MEELLSKIRRFTKERGWNKFHTPRNLATSISLEAAEVLEKFQWKLNNKVTKKEREELKDELADVFIYLLQLADILKINLIEAAHQKIGKNALKYPVEKAKGRADKYTKLKS